MVDLVRSSEKPPEVIDDLGPRAIEDVLVPEEDEGEGFYAVG